MTTFTPNVGDIFMMSFNNGDRSWRDCVFRVLDRDDRITIAKMVAGHSFSKTPYVFVNEDVKFYETSKERAALLGMKTEK